MVVCCFSTCWKDLSAPRIVPNISHPHQVGEDGEDQSLAEASVDNCLILVSYSHSRLTRSRHLT